MRRAAAALAMRAARAVPGMRHGTIAADAAAGGAEEASRVAANRLLYRASQRGLLELDIIIGKWTAEHVKGLDGEGRRHLTNLLALENPDLLNWLTGRAPPPAGSDRRKRATRSAATVGAGEGKGWGQRGAPWA